MAALADCGDRLARDFLALEARRQQLEAYQWQSVEGIHCRRTVEEHRRAFSVSVLERRIEKGEREKGHVQQRNQVIRDQCSKHLRDATSRLPAPSAHGGLAVQGELGERLRMNRDLFTKKVETQSYAWHEAVSDQMRREIDSFRVDAAHCQARQQELMQTALQQELLGQELVAERERVRGERSKLYALDTEVHDRLRKLRLQLEDKRGPIDGMLSAPSAAGMQALAAAPAAAMASTQAAAGQEVVAYRGVPHVGGGGSAARLALGDNSDGSDLVCLSPAELAAAPPPPGEYVPAPGTRQFEVYQRLKNYEREMEADLRILAQPAHMPLSLQRGCADNSHAAFRAPSMFAKGPGPPLIVVNMPAIPVPPPMRRITPSVDGIACAAAAAPAFGAAAVVQQMRPPIFMPPHTEPAAPQWQAQVQAQTQAQTQAQPLAWTPPAPPSPWQSHALPAQEPPRSHGAVRQPSPPHYLPEQQPPDARGARAHQAPWHSLERSPSGETSTEEHERHAAARGGASALRSASDQLAEVLAWTSAPRHNSLLELSSASCSAAGCGSLGGVARSPADGNSSGVRGSARGDVSLDDHSGAKFSLQHELDGPRGVENGMPMGGAVIGAKVSASPPASGRPRPALPQWTSPAGPEDFATSAARPQSACSSQTATGNLTRDRFGAVADGVTSTADSDATLAAASHLAASSVGHSKPASAADGAGSIAGSGGGLAAAPLFVSPAPARSAAPSPAAHGEQGVFSGAATAPSDVAGMAPLALGPSPLSARSAAEVLPRSAGSVHAVSNTPAPEEKLEPTFASQPGAVLPAELAAACSTGPPANGPRDASDAGARVGVSETGAGRGAAPPAPASAHAGNVSKDSTESLGLVDTDGEQPNMDAWIPMSSRGRAGRGSPAKADSTEMSKTGFVRSVGPTEADSQHNTSMSFTFAGSENSPSLNARRGSTPSAFAGSVGHLETVVVAEKDAEEPGGLSAVPALAPAPAAQLQLQVASAPPWRRPLDSAALALRGPPQRDKKDPGLDISSGSEPDFRGSSELPVPGENGSDSFTASKSPKRRGNPLAMGSSLRIGGPPAVKSANGMMRSQTAMPKAAPGGQLPSAGSALGGEASDDSVEEVRSVVRPKATASPSSLGLGSLAGGGGGRMSIAATLASRHGAARGKTSANPLGGSIDWSQASDPRW